MNECESSAGKVQTTHSMLTSLRASHRGQSTRITMMMYVYRQSTPRNCHFSHPPLHQSNLI